MCNTAQALSKFFSFFFFFLKQDNIKCWKGRLAIALLSWLRRWARSITAECWQRRATAGTFRGGGGQGADRGVQRDFEVAVWLVAESQCGEQRRVVWEKLRTSIRRVALFWISGGRYTQVRRGSGCSRHDLLSPCWCWSSAQSHFCQPLISYTFFHVIGFIYIHIDISTAGLILLSVYMFMTYLHSRSWRGIWWS